MNQNVPTIPVSYCQNIYDIIGESLIPSIQALVESQKDFNGYANIEPHQGGKDILYQRHRNNPDVLRKIHGNNPEQIVVTFVDIKNGVLARFSKKESFIGPLTYAFKENFLLACGLDINGQPLPELDPV